jgi:hypothetical protein
MIRSPHLSAIPMARRAGAVLCVLLVFLTGFVAVVHVHPDSAKTPQHSCSVCALNHSGIAPIQIVVAAPTLARTVLAEVTAAAPKSLLLVPSLYIRPPPAV